VLTAGKHGPQKLHGIPFRSQFILWLPFLSLYQYIPEVPHLLALQRMQDKFFACCKKCTSVVGYRK
jgi:hypothetical protein